MHILLQPLQSRKGKYSEFIPFKKLFLCKSMYKNAIGEKIKSVRLGNEILHTEECYLWFFFLSFE